MESKKNRVGYLLKNTTIFAISNIASKIITFLLVPLYTYFLTTNEFGVVDLLFTICGILTPVFTFNIVEAVYRFSMDKDADNNKIMSVALIAIIFSIVSSLITIPILSLFEEYDKYKIYFYFYLLVSAISQILLSNLKGQQKLKSFAAGNIILTFLVAIFNIIFLTKLNMKIKGYFLAYIIANIVVIIYAFFQGKFFKVFKNFKLDKNLLKNMVKYSVVLIPTSFMWWILNSSDRIMISKYVSSAANGIYAVSYKLPTILSTLTSIFNQAWMFSAIEENDSKDKEKFTNYIFENMFFLIVLFSIIMITFLKPFLKVYVSDSYFEAWKYVPFLIVGSVFTTLGTFIATSYSVHKDSRGYLLSGLSGAILNIILNFILIPKFKVYGAAIATCISYIATFVYRIFDTKRYVKIDFKKKYLLLVIFLVLNCILLYIDNIYGFLLQIIEMLAVFIIYRKFWTNIIFKLKSKILKKALK